jgi:hypothetical protein
MLEYFLLLVNNWDNLLTMAWSADTRVMIRIIRFYGWF